jgi:hypothetical protein
MRDLLNILAEAEIVDRITAALSPYNAIAWDFDETLIDCPASPILWDFIKNNSGIKHVIVTFRSHGLEHAIWRDLERRGAPIGQFDFDGIISVDYDVWEAHNECEEQRRGGALTGPLTESERAYIEWKGEACHENGLSVLVDDKTVHVKQGCDKYGIALFDPLTFL